MNYYTQNFKCCGVNEIIGINDPHFSCTTLLPWLLDKFNYYSKAYTNSDTAGRSFYVFTLAIINPKADYRPFEHGVLPLSRAEATVRIKKFRAWLKTNSFGKLIVTPSALNPNTHGNTLIKMLIWIPNNEKLLQEAQANPPTKLIHPSIGVNYFIHGS